MSASPRATIPSSRHGRRVGAGVAVALLCGVATFGAANAAPDTLGSDPMSRLLEERGLIGPSSAERVARPTVAPPPASEGRAPAEPSITHQVRERASEMVVSAMNFLGVPYRRGGNDAETGFDCSGFTKHLFELTFGLVLPRRVDDQASAAGLVKVQRTDLQPGDLVFFNTLRRTFSHVGIYVGEGRFIHSPRSGAEVRVEDMRGAYWSQRFTGARRVATDPVMVATADRHGSGDLRPRVAASAARSAPSAAMLPAALASTPATGPQSTWLP